jgi:hypothetical protein
MALPRLNEAPQYTMTIPSNGMKIKFRPFLVKEQKVLLMAHESKDPVQIMNSLLNCIEACCEGVDIRLTTTFDADFMFAQIRSKSVGETASILAECECGVGTEVKINVDQVKINVDPKTDMVIELTPTISVRMKYPTYDDFLYYDVMNGDNTAAEMFLNTIISCMESIITEDDNLLIRDESKEEIGEFLSSLTTEQFEKISNFVENIPRMKHEEPFVCSACSKENVVKLEGLTDFFS